jgi:hypothetical protein
MSNPRRSQLFLTIRKVASSDRHFIYLAPPLLTALVVYLAYLFTHPYPGLGAGLFSAMAEQIIAHGYGLPASIPYYTAGGIPFAYPPLFLYLYAALWDVTGLGPLVLTRVLPGIFVIGCVVATYALAAELLSTRLQASVAAVAVATSPTIFRMLLTAGGIVRAPAFAIMVVGLYVGVKLFRTHSRRWLLAAIGCFALLLLSHPVNAAFFAFSYLFFFAAFDRSPHGLAYGVLVAVVPFVLISPWLATVISRHGVDVFLQAAGTHGGLGIKPLNAVIFWYAPRIAFPSLWKLLILVGGFYLLADRQYVLIMWFALSVMVFSRRITMLVGVLIAAVGLCRAARATKRMRLPYSSSLPFKLSTAFVVVLCVYAAGTGSIYAANYPALDNPDSTQMYLSEDEIDAMQWVRTETAPNASFVVVGDIAEWFPLFAERTSLVTFRGTEWTEGESQTERIQTTIELANCDGAACLTRELSQQNLSPTYLYLSADEYSVEYNIRDQSTTMRASLVRSERYEIVFTNEEALVVRVVEGAGGLAG